MPFPSPWNNVNTSIFSVMTKAAQELGAVNLAQGFPNFDGPDVCKDAAIAAINAGANQYAPSTGILELRRLIAQRQQNRLGLPYDAETEICVFSGATEALFCSIAAFTAPGDEVIAFAPSYDSYVAATTVTGAKLRLCNLAPPNWNIDFSALERLISARTRILILNSPHNPTGRVFDRDELSAIAKLASKHDLLVITDEVYEEITFASNGHLSIASLSGMRERTIVISSTAKTFSLTGWKVGYACAPENLLNAPRALHQFVVFCSATPLQHGMVAALKLPEAYFEQLRLNYLNARNALMEELESAGFRCQAPQGTYFILGDYSALSELNDLAFANQLLREAGVASIPISVFYGTEPTPPNLRYLRFAFCKDTATLKAAGDRLQRWAKRRP